jgi:RHS repeat-associated protein
LLATEHYELSNHLGNVLQVVTDRKLAIDSGDYNPETGGYYTMILGGDGVVDYYVSDVVSQSDYYPFGMLLPGRNSSEDEYRYGFNGMEMDDEIHEVKGSSYDFGARLYNSRVGRWLTVDPHVENYPAQSPYTFSLNSPLLYDDPNGKDARITITEETNAETGEKQQVITISTKIYLTGKALSPEEQASLDSYKDKVFGTDYTSSDGSTIVRFDVDYVNASAPSLNLPESVNHLLENGPAETLSEIPLKATADTKAGRSNITGSSQELDQGDNYATFSPYTVGESVSYPMASKLDIDKYSNPNEFGFAIIHESLHLLGLSDNYYKNEDGVYVDYPGATGTPMGLYLDPKDDPYGFYDGKMELSQTQVDNIVNGVNEGVKNGTITDINEGKRFPGTEGITYGLYNFLNSGKHLDDGDNQLQENKQTLGTPAGPAKEK